MLEVMMVAVGGGIGATSRYLVSAWAADKFGTNFPYGTLIVNVIGCFIIGAYLLRLALLVVLPLFHHIVMKLLNYCKMLKL